MTVRITTLVENTVSWANLLGEWGLSMLVETEELTFLSDAGTTSAAAKNSVALGVSLTGVDVVTISHGHFDHMGGLIPLLQFIRKPVHVIGHPSIFDSKYAYHPGSKMCEYVDDSDYEYIGAPYSREEYERCGARFVLGTDPVWLTDNVVTSGEVPVLTDYETIDAMLLVKQGDEYVPDPLPDDLSVFIKTEKGLVVVLGCAHRGIINHLWRGLELTGLDRVYAVVGGTHLIAADDARIAETIRELKRLQVEVVAASHCTGFKAACALSQAFGDAFQLNNAGTRLTF
ncbi:MAG: MBL fold metallo-hydrolase [Dehalococcoidia bacterium]|nr:MBL fold metallo-hydrolase [Dehalococcoidia bacterium]